MGDRANRMKRRASGLFALALLLGYGASAASAAVLYGQPAGAGGALLQSSWWDPNGSDYDQYVWDDFTLPATQAITEIHWRGGYDPMRFGSGGPVVDFTVEIWSSIQAGTQPDIGSVFAPNPVAQYVVGGNAAETLAGTFGGTTMYDYAFTLPTPFTAVAGAKYWVQIEAWQHGIPDWGLAAGTSGDGVYFRRIANVGDIFYQAPPGDAAFAIVGPGAPASTATATIAATATATPTVTATPVPTVTAPATVAATPTSTPTPAPTPGLDRFTCYSAGPAAGASKFAGVAGEILVDELGASTATVKKAAHVCAPTDVLGADPTAPAHAEHVESYQITSTTRFAARTNLQVFDEFNAGGLRIDARKPAYLFVPAVSVPGGPTPPLPAAFATDHFQCYQASVTAGSAKFAPVAGVTLADALGTMTVAVQKPKLFCAPVDENGADPTAPQHRAHLMCYQVKQLDAVKFARVPGLFLNDQFGAEQLDAKKPSLLCVPATTTP